MAQPTDNTTSNQTPATTTTTKVEHINAEKDFKPNEYEDFGFYFFYDRRNLEHQIPWYQRFITLTGSREKIRKVQCEKNVENCIDQHPGVKLMFSALKSFGCEPNLLRHFSCEYCDAAVKGGFDPTTNQTVVCYNSVNSYNTNDVAKSMIESLIQSFDYCRANYNMHDLEHLACTKIRAANLTGCSMWDAVSNDSAIFSFSNKQKECVRRSAAISLQMVRNISKEEAFKVIDKVFDKCYADTEPFGRRIRNYGDYERAYLNRRRVGYP